MKKIISLVLTSLLIFSTISAFASFDDIDSATNAWAGIAIEQLTELGVINGYEDGTFRPHGDVTRAEFAKMLSVAFDLDAADASFDDISAHWANEYIKAVSGNMYTPGENFEPDKEATRADIAYAAASVLGLEASDNGEAERFSDYELVIDAMKDNILASVQNGIILGYEDMTIRPNDNVTRAEAAVIISRTLNIKNDSVEDPSSPETPETSEPSDKEDSSDTDVPDVTPPADEGTESSTDHIYTLYPGRDLLLISSVSATAMTADGEDAYRITYRLANSEEEYSSVIPADVEVAGIKSSVSQLASGDVLTMNTAFHGYIGNLYVFASFGGSVPAFDTEVTGYGKDKYKLVCGKLTDIKLGGRATNITVESNSEILEEVVLTGLETNVYSSWKKNSKWSLSDLGNIDLENEDVYVFIRYTGGVSSDIIVSDILR